MRLLVMISLVWIMSVPVVAEESSSEFTALSKEYAGAIKAQNEELIKEAWNKIEDQPEAKSYLKEHFPNQYAAFKYHAIAYRLEDIKSKYFEKLQYDVIVTEPQGRGPQNRNIIKGLPNQDRLPNQKVVRNSPNQDRLSNVARVRRSPIQSRPSNQKTLRRRARVSRIAR